MPLGSRVGDAVAGITGIDHVRLAILHDEVLEERVIRMSLDEEVPWAVHLFGIRLVLPPAVVRNSVVGDSTDFRRHIRCITGEKEGAAVVVIVAQCYSSIDSFGGRMLEGFLAVDTAVLVVMPPDDLACAEIDSTVLDVLERHVE